MKTTRILALAAVAALAFAGGCNKSAKTEGSAGAVGDKAKCTDSTAGCCQKKEGSMGTVDAAKKDCCTKKEGSMGAVSTDAKTGTCTGAKATTCTGQK